MIFGDFSCAVVDDSKVQAALSVIFVDCGMMVRQMELLSMEFARAMDC